MLTTLMNAAKKFTVTDWFVVKLNLVIVGLLLAKWFPVLTSLHRARYLGAIVLCKIYIWSRISQLNDK